MPRQTGKTYLLVLLLSLPWVSFAETGYIIDRIKVGVHSAADLDSPIIKLLATGAQFEVIQRGVDMSQIKDPDGTTGWINTAYIIDTNTTATAAQAQQTQQQAETLASLTQQLQQAEEQVSNLKQQLKTAQNNPQKDELTSLRLKVGELQAKLTEERITANKTDPTELEDYIKQVENKNASLQKQLLEQQSANQPATGKQTFEQIFTTSGLIILASLFVLGMLVGIVLYDFYKRQQHGGFRI